MYTPKSFRVDEPDTLRAFVDEHGFGTLFTDGPSGPFATHLPFVLQPGRGPHGTLVSHMARANPHWRSFGEGRQALVTFLGPHAYVSPAWYATPEAVPTWNYVTVHARGVPVVREDEAALRASLAALVARYEGPDGWSVDARAGLVERLLPAIVGFEMPIDWIGGKFKLNQNRSEEDRRGVIEALERSADAEAGAVARWMTNALDGVGGAP